MADAPGTSKEYGPPSPPPPPGRVYYCVSCFTQFFIPDVATKPETCHHCGGSLRRLS